MLRTSLSAIALLLTGACRGGAGKPATRAEALDACNRGCFSTASEQAQPEVARVYCTAYCDCFIAARFDASGKQRKSTPEELTNHTTGCAALAKGKVGQP
jgi:hypothetical protein